MNKLIIFIIILARSFAEQVTSVTGIQNDFPLTTGAGQVLFVTSTAEVTFTGFTVNGNQPQDGDWVVVSVASPSDIPIKFAHLDSGSTATSRFKTSSFAGDTISRTGMALMRYVASDGYWRVGVISHGRTVLSAYSAGNFLASGSMNWVVDAGDVFNLRHSQQSRTVTLYVQLLGTSMSGTPSHTLGLVIPGIVPFGGFSSIGYARDNGTNVPIKISTYYTGGAGMFVIQKLDGSNWNISANNTDVCFQMSFELE